VPVLATVRRSPLVTMGDADRLACTGDGDRLACLGGEGREPSATEVAAGRLVGRIGLRWLPTTAGIAPNDNEQDRRRPADVVWRDLTR
jgi:hypothetical protein